MLCKSLEFRNAVGQKIKIIDIPVLEKNNRFYFMIQVRLQLFISIFYTKPQPKSCYSFREYLKRKMSWPDFKELYRILEFRHNA
ncbi:DUF2535 family protein [Neobacillus sp. FSL H8-0543]|uniref:DUF2535 family protein n=1 Tax=Neobacillus sp. FSL H8-0543 TaxID=2954672 RepID=UPI003158C4BD